LFYEPDGLLLRACLIPVDERHGGHLLTFQLGYLGAGEIGVHVVLEGAVDRGDGVFCQLEPTAAAATLNGTARWSSPGVTLTYVSIPDTAVRYRYTVWGQPAADDEMRGELRVEISGQVPLLSAVTTAGVTSVPLPKMCYLPGNASVA
jgi:hypothetical protein